MDGPRLPASVAELVDRLASLPKVDAVSLLSCGPEGARRGDRSWDLAVYYREHFDPNWLSHLDGTIVAPGTWGRIMNGGARLTVDGIRVMVHFRDGADVEHWLREARAGRFEVDGHDDYVAGVPTYTLAAELALGEVLAGSLERVEYPEKLADEGAAHWRREAESSLDDADRRAAHGDASGVLHHLAKAGTEAAHARLCEARRWTINEKEILERAELAHLTQILTALKADPVTLMQRVMQARTLLFD